MAVPSIDSFARQLRARETSAAEMVEQCLRHIEASDRRLNAYILVMADQARKQAAEADRELAAGVDRGPLHGVPISVKDIFDVAGTVTTAASRVRDGIVAQHDAAAISRLRRAGAVIVGKTNLHEFAFGTTNEDSAFGPALNPLDETRSPGGSSGGSAASVVAGMALGSLGTDTGGSIRIPAAACGLVGLKPAYGELPATGVIPLSRTLDHVGPITATVTDAWHMFQAMHDHAPGKPLSAAPVRDLRLAIPRRYFCELLDDEVRAAFEAAVETLTRAGATVVDVDIPHASLIATVYLHIVFGDAAAFHADTLDVMPERYTPNVRLRLEMARYVTAEDYVRSLDGRRTLTREVDEALTAVDAIMLPTLPIVAPPIGATTVQVGPTRETVRTVMLRLTQLFNLTGHPAISLPCRTSTSGLPCGLQLAGAAGQTRNLLQIARAIEIAMGGGPLS